MLVETRFDFGDSVWFRLRGELTPGKVSSVRVHSGLFGLSITYSVQYSETDGEILDESDVFESREEGDCPVKWPEYKALLERAEDMEVYDGRGKGVDVYECDGCGEVMFTRYADKGVTPYCMPCKCRGTMSHKSTVQVVPCRDAKVCNWVRPIYDDFVKLSPGMQDHVMNGGLVLEEELV